MASDDGHVKHLMHVHCIRSKEGHPAKVFCEAGPFQSFDEFFASSGDIQTNLLFSWYDSEEEYLKRHEDPVGPSRSAVLTLKNKLDSTKTVTIQQAADFLKVSRRTIERMLSRKGESVKPGRLERLPGKRGITVRSLLAYAESTYAPSAEFDESAHFVRQPRH